MSGIMIVNRKKAPLLNKIGNFDSRVGWSRRIQPNGKYPEYSLWKIFKGKRYMVICSILSSDRRVIADALRLHRIYLQNAIDHASGKVQTLSADTRNDVYVTRYIRNQCERESEHFGPKTDLYFSKWIGRISIGLKNSGFQHNKIDDILIDNIDWLRRCCERLIQIEDVVNQIVEVENRRKSQRENASLVAQN